MNFAYEVILCIVNAGHADTVMDTAKEYGARGGTVIHARGTANGLAEKKFEIPVQPEKEMVMILVPSAIKDDILRALYRLANGTVTARDDTNHQSVRHSVGRRTLRGVYHA